VNKARNQNSGNFRSQYDNNIQQNLKNIRSQGEDNNLQWNLNQLESLINGMESLPDVDTGSDSPSVEEMGFELTELKAQAEAASDFDISSIIPSIVYHTEFDRITDSAPIGSMDQPQNRTFRNLLKLAGIDYEGFHQKDGFEQNRELRNAGAEISGDVNAIWDQKSVKVSISISRKEFMVQIEDDSLSDGESEEDLQRQLIRPSSRSEGFRWFFSFYTNLTAETNGNKENKLILLADPAVVLHP